MKNNKKFKKNELVTRAYLDKRFALLESAINRRFDRLSTYLDYRFKPLEEMTEDHDRFKNFVADKLDWLIEKYSKFDDEYTVAAEQQLRTDKRIENHEVRIKLLENKSRKKPS